MTSKSPTDSPILTVAVETAEKIRPAINAIVSSRLYRRRKRLEKQIMMYLLHVGVRRSQAEVAVLLGVDRTTVGYACGVVEDIRDDPAIDALLTSLEAVLVCGSTLATASRV